MLISSRFRNPLLAAALMFSFTTTLCAQIPSGRVALWRGENNALDLVNGNTGILGSGTTFAPDRFGTGYAFRMTDVSGIIPVTEINSTLSLRRYTIAAWVKSDGTTPISQGILSKGGGSLNYTLYLTGLDDPHGPNLPLVDLFSGAHYAAVSSQPCTPGVWCHVAGSYDGTNLRIYVNGVLTGTAPAPDGFSTAGPIVLIGGYPTRQAPFVGGLDEISVFNRALSDSEVMTLYQTVEPPPAPLPPAPSGLVALWRGENNALDSVGGNTGVLPAGDTFVPDRNGTGSAFRMIDTSTTIPVVEVNQGLSLRTYTVAAWVKSDGTTYAPQCALSKGGTGSLNYALFLSGTSDAEGPNLAVIDFYVGNNDAGIHYQAIASQACQPGVWCHIAGSYDGQNLRVYVNGVLSGTTPAPDGFVSSNPTVLIGGYPNPQYPSPFVGALDEISVFNRALSDAEVAAYCACSASTTIASSPAGLSFTADGTSYTAPHTFNWPASSVHSISWTTPIAGAPGSRLAFTGWSDGDTTNPRSYTATASAATLTGNFTTQYFLTTTAGAGGSISPASGWFNSGSTVTVSATASAGYQFTGFSGDLTGSSTPQSVTMSAARSVTASFGLSGQAVVRLIDSAGNPLQGGTVSYYNNGWQPFGVTDVTGQAALSIPAGSYTFSVTYANTQQQITQNIGITPVVVFQTRPVTVQLKNGSGALMDTGVVQYYSNGWNSFGSTTGGQVRKELLAGSYTFSLTYASGSEQLTQNVGANPLVVFQTTAVTVQLRDSSGNPLDTGTVQYYANGWNPFGQTSGGKVIKELLPGSYTFALTYLGTQQQITQNVATTAVVQFQTRSVVVQLKDSLGNPLDTGNVQYYANGWTNFGSTSGGQVAKELLPGSYTFALTYAGAQQQIAQNVGANPLIVFQTKAVTVQLKDSAGNPLDTGAVQYYANGWLNFGQTASGQIAKELLPGSYTFALTYAGAQQQIAQNVGANPLIVFQTKAVTVLLKNSAGNPIDTGTVQYYANGWLNFGQTIGGQVVKELLPGVYPIAMNYANGHSQLSQDMRVSATVSFQTGAVHSGTGTCTNYYANGWQPFVDHMELLPGSYTFHFSDGTPDGVASVTPAATTLIH